MKSNCNYEFYKFSSKFTFAPFLSFHRMHKQEPNIKHAGSVLMRTIYAFCLFRFALCLEDTSMVAHRFHSNLYYESLNTE